MFVSDDTPIIDYNYEDDIGLDGLILLNELCRDTHRNYRGQHEILLRGLSPNTFRYILSILVIYQKEKKKEKK